MSYFTRYLGDDVRKKEKHNRNSADYKIFYGNAELIGYTDSEGKSYTPQEMYGIMEWYEAFLKTRMYKDVRKIELENNYPEGWLNLVISGLINNNSTNGLAKNLVKEFRDRGYSKAWLPEYKKEG